MNNLWDFFLFVFYVENIIQFEICYLEWTRTAGSCEQSPTERRSSGRSASSPSRNTIKTSEDRDFFFKERNFRIQNKDQGKDKREEMRKNRKKT